MRRGGGSGDRQATGTENIQPETTEAYGRWIGARWAHRTNLVWAIGGDQRWHPSDLPHYEALARGLRDGGAQGPFTLHPWDAFSDVDQTGQYCVSRSAPRLSVGPVAGRAQYRAHHSVAARRALGQ